MKDIRILRHIAQDMRVIASGGSGAFRHRIRTHLDNGFVELPLFHNGTAIRRDEITFITAERVDSGLRLRWKHIHKKLISRSRKDRNVVRSIQTAKVLKGNTKASA